MRSDHRFYCRPKLIIFQHNGLLMLIKYLGTFLIKKKRGYKKGVIEMIFLSKYSVELNGVALSDLSVQTQIYIPVILFFD